MRDKVSAAHFYQDDGDKVKQNWFLYEYANILFSKIEGTPALAGYRKKHTAENISAFSVYFSKRLRQSISDLVIGQTTEFVIDARYVHEFYPQSSQTQINKLVDAAAEAWTEHAQVCLNCPKQCLTDTFELTDMFDNLKHSGWPTR